VGKRDDVRRMNRKRIQSGQLITRQGILKMKHIRSTSPMERIDNGYEWVIERRRGYDNKLLHTYTYPTEGEAIDAWNVFQQAKKFAGLGGKWTEYYTYPTKRRARR
jgi:hypothetical protein